MPTSSDMSFANRVVAEWIIPPGCTPRVDIYDSRPNVGRFHSWNLIDRRPKPDPTDLFKNVTNLPLQYKGRYTGPIGYQTTEFPCPHTPSHGSTIRRIWRWSPAGYSPVAQHSSDLWSLRARSKVDAKKVNLGSTLAEYKESVRMFGDFTEHLWNAFNVIRKKRVRRRITPCAIPASVLQYNFGIAPLASDLYDSIEVLQYRLELPIFSRISTTGTERLRGVLRTGDFNVEYRSTKSQRATFFIELEPSSLNPINFGNPIEWAWELIPFSFVVDWAIPIGDWLGSLDTLKGTKAIYGTVTTKVNESHKVDFAPSGNYIQKSQGRGLWKSHQRDVINTIPLPPFPKWEPSSSYKRLINASSILGVMNKKCRHK